MAEQRKHLPVLVDTQSGTTLCGRWVSLVKLAGPEEDPTCRMCARVAEGGER